MSNKTQFKTIDEYISSFPVETQAILEKIRKIIQRAAPKVTEAVSYNMPTFDLGGEHLVFFAGWKNYISLYPLPSGDNDFQQKILIYKNEKSTARFPLHKPIPYELIREIVVLLIKEKNLKH